jgi:hypothetical protein
MRKLKPVEVIALTALMSIGANADSQEAEESLPVTLARVTSTSIGMYGWSQFYQPPSETAFYNPGPPFSLSATPNRPNKPVPTAATKQRALNCVLQYADYPIAANGWTIDYNPNWGFRNTVGGNWSFPPSYQVPSYNGLWMELYGTTRPIGGVNNRITIFQLGYADFATLVNTLAHEFAHTWGMSEGDADIIGDRAEAAFKQDNGAKCGGL